MLILQADSFNRSNINTIVVVSLTSSLKLVNAPGNVLCGPRGTGLPAASVVNVTQVSTLDRRFLLERIGALPLHALRAVEEGVKLVLGV